MSYLVLARKYRPQTFDDVVGQQAVVQTLKNAVKDNRLAHAYLFVGPRGVGKTSIARILAKALNCPKVKDGVPCNACDACRAISAGEDLDVFEFDAASNTHLEDIQSKILDTVHFRPSRSPYRIYIIDEVHMISKHAFNALLKTLEEPPSHVKFIFATTEAGKIPETIISRCQRYDFRNMTAADIVQRLEQICRAEKVKAEDGTLAFVARLARGGMRDAQSLLDQAIAFTGGQLTAAALHDVFGTVTTDFLVDLLEKTARGDGAAAFPAVADLQRQGRDLGLFLSQAAELTRDLLVARLIGGDSDLLLVDAAHRARLAELAASGTPAQWQAMLSILHEAEARLQNAASPATVVELAFLNMANCRDLGTLPEILGALRDLERRLPAAGNAPASPAAAALDLLTSAYPPPAAPARPAASAPARVAPPPASVPAASAPVAKPAPAAASTAKPAATTTSAATASDADALQQARELWPLVKDAVRARDRALAGYFNDVTLVAATRGKLVLGIPGDYAIHRENLEDYNNHKLIEEAVAETLGRRLVVAYHGMTAPSAPAPQPEDERQNDTRMLRIEDLKRDPLLRDTLQLFDGKITEIEG